MIHLSPFMLIGCNFSHPFLAQLGVGSAINRYSGRAGRQRIAFQHEHHHGHSSDAENGGLYWALAEVGGWWLMMVDVFRFHHFVYLKISYISTVFVWLHVKLPVQAWSITVSRSIIRIISFRSLFDPWSPPRLNETERNHWSRPCRQTLTPAFTGPTRAGLVGRRSASTELIQSIAAAPSSGFHLRRWQQPRICHRKVLGLVTKVWNPGATIRVVCVCVCVSCMLRIQASVAWTWCSHETKWNPTNFTASQPVSSKFPPQASSGTLGSRPTPCSAVASLARSTHWTANKPTSVKVCLQFFDAAGMFCLLLQHLTWQMIHTSRAWKSAMRLPEHTH